MPEEGCHCRTEWLPLLRHTASLGSCRALFKRIQARHCGLEGEVIGGENVLTTEAEHAVNFCTPPAKTLQGFNAFEHLIVAHAFERLKIEGAIENCFGETLCVEDLGVVKAHSF